MSGSSARSRLIQWWQSHLAYSGENFADMFLQSDWLEDHDEVLRRKAYKDGQDSAERESGDHFSYQPTLVRKVNATSESITEILVEHEKYTANWCSCGKTYQRTGAGDEADHRSHVATELITAIIELNEATFGMDEGKKGSKRVKSAIAMAQESAEILKKNIRERVESRINAEILPFDDPSNKPFIEIRDELWSATGGAPE